MYLIAFDWFPTSMMVSSNIPNPISPFGSDVTHIIWLWMYRELRYYIHPMHVNFDTGWESTDYHYSTSVWIHLHHYSHNSGGVTLESAPVVLVWVEHLLIHNTYIRLWITATQLVQRYCVLMVFNCPNSLALGKGLFRHDVMTITAIAK